MCVTGLRRPSAAFCLLNSLQAPPTGAYLGISRVSRTPPTRPAVARAVKAENFGVDPALCAGITRPTRSSSSSSSSSCCSLLPPWISRKKLDEMR